MSTYLTSAIRQLPRKRTSLTIRPTGAPGRYVVKDAVSNAFFQIGEEEYFLLTQLDGPTSKDNLRREYLHRFGAPLSSRDLNEFLESGLKYGFLDEADTLPESTPRDRSRLKGHSALYFRYRLFDPDRILTRIEPAIRFVWTLEFVVASFLLLATAIVLAVANRGEWVSMFPDKLTWETAWLTFTFILLATLMHEFAHGLTCKHFGGKVHEIGALMILFMPCMYCNVSDAWLFPERWKRMVVGIAGTYLDMLIWAVMILVWRITEQDTFLNYSAWLLSSVCLARTFFNLTPLLRLDGYYVLADWLNTPNLSIDGPRRYRQIVQRVLWGAPRPEPHPKASVLLLWGAANWFFMCTFLYAIIVSFLRIDAGSLTILKTAFSAYAGFMIGRSVLKVFFSREIFKMIRSRPMHTFGWIAVIFGGALLMRIPIQDRASGTFSVRPATRVEIVASEAGFLEQIVLDEGQTVESGTVITTIRVPSLESDIMAARHAVHAAEVELRRLTAGPRPEEIELQRSRVARASDWLERARRQLEIAQLSQRQQMVRLDQRIAQADLVAKQSRATADYSRSLVEHQAISLQSQRKFDQTADLALFEVGRIRSVKEQRQVIGVLEHEAEVARCNNKLAEEEADLRLLLLGTRPEDIDAQRARLSQFQQQLALLEQTRRRLSIVTPVKGLITTSHLKERNGKFVQQGEVICVVEELKDVLAEVSIPERVQRKISPGQPVELRAYARPNESIPAIVERLSPSVTASANTTQSTITAYCRPLSQDVNAVSGMTGKARVYLGPKAIGGILIDRVSGFLRTQIWQW